MPGRSQFICRQEHVPSASIMWSGNTGIPERAYSRAASSRLVTPELRGLGIAIHVPDELVRHGGDALVKMEMLRPMMAAGLAQELDPH